MYRLNRMEFKAKPFRTSDKIFFEEDILLRTKCAVLNAGFKQKDGWRNVES